MHPSARLPVLRAMRRTYLYSVCVGLPWRDALRLYDVWPSAFSVYWPLQHRRVAYVGAAAVPFCAAGTVCQAVAHCTGQLPATPLLQRGALRRGGGNRLCRCCTSSRGAAAIFRDAASLLCDIAVLALIGGLRLAGGQRLQRDLCRVLLLRSFLCYNYPILIPWRGASGCFLPVNASMAISWNVRHRQLAGRDEKGGTFGGRRRLINKVASRIL